MYIWTSEEIQKILIQLNEKKLPFSKYSFSLNGGVLKLLGKGGFSSVYEAEDRKNPSKKFAIKVIGFEDKNVDSDFFRTSTRVQKDLSYKENIVKVFDYKELLVWVDEQNNVIRTEEVFGETKVIDCLHLQFVVMERNEPVIARDKAGKIHLTPPWLEYPNEKEVLKLAYQIGKALLAAHESNVLHRDIKLENIFYSHKEECYKLGDFGIAKKTNDGTASTVACTKGYGAPEIIGSLDDKYDVTADIYSLGILLYVLLNELRFPDADSYQVNSKAQYQKGYILPRPKHGSDVLCAIIEKMCKFNPDDRYQSMDEVMNALEELLYTSKVSYQREKKETYLLAGTLFLLLGAAIGKMTYFADVHMNFSMWEIVFGGSLVCKFLCSVGGKKIWPLNLLAFVTGMMALVQDGLTWWKVVGYLLLLLYNVFPGILATAFLLVQLMTVLQAHFEFSYTNFETVRWLAPLFVSLGIVWLFMHMLLVSRDEKWDTTLLKKDAWWGMVCIIYLLVAITGLWPQDSLFLLKGQEEFITVQEVLKIGITGLAICVAWSIRERVLRKMEGMVSHKK